MDLYDRDYIHIEEYAQLPIDYPPGLTLAQIFQAMYIDYQLVPSHFKKSLLSYPSYKYIHVILSRLLTGHGDSTGVLSRLDLLYLHPMI